MASLSLPRVLQLKKNSLDAEREQFEKFQTLAIQKAINSIETPVKEKHVRSTIIGTFQEQSAITYWMVAVRLPLQDNRIVAWKFCHVTHKLLREGHPACLDDSQRHISMIENLGKLWVHLREGYGKLVHLYCNLLVVKLKFHARNPRFPGNLQLTADELDAIAENDVNNYFQLCVELFDYMDEILNLQAAVFDSLGNARANSMTASGQCRLAALIPCAQDSSQIYDCNVRLLFRLHASLPADTLSGHRERFRQQFKKLSSFYKHASSLQYYRNLLTLPVLPSNPPNFLLQSDFGTYVPPVVSIPEPQADEVDSVGSLIDTSDTISQVSVAASPESEQAWSRATPSPQPDPVLERDRLIDHLQHELRRMRTEVTSRVEERNNILGAMREMSTSLETQLHAVKTELDQERKKSYMLSVQTPEIQQKLADTEDKAKLTDEKFQKLKGAYTQLREEHINLIRQKAEVDKLTTSLRAATAQHESAKTALQQQLNDRMKDVELLQQSASSSEEIEAYKNEILSLRVDLENSRQKETELETLRASMEALQIEHNTAKTEQEEKLNTLAGELKETKEILDNIKHEKDDRETELSKVKEELIGLREKSGDEYKKVVEEKEAALKQVAELTQQHQLEKETLEAKLDMADNKRLNVESELQDLLQQNTVLEADIATLKIQLEEAKRDMDKQSTRIVSCAGEAAVEVTQDALAVLDGAHELDQAAADLAAKALEELAKHTQVKGNEEAVAKAAMLAAHSTAQLSAHLTDLANTATNVEISEKLTAECRSMLTATQQCVDAIRNGSVSAPLCAAARARVGAARAGAAAARRGGGALSVEDELAGMDRAIEEAAEQIESLLAASRAADSGLKLEVNSNILDACTTLMAAVKLLVQDSRKLQQELGDPTTRQNMYRKNPQWSEGLISASKAVVFAAKLLVTSADEAVGASGRFEGVSAAAHEVAGSTAQLVAASRARAPPVSQTLGRLTAASRSVAAATGALVAAVRAAAARSRDSETMDTSALTLTATRRLEMESKVRSLELEAALDAERAKLAALRKRHYQLAQMEENGNMTNGKE